MISSNYESSELKASALYPGVRFRLDKMSFCRRIELMKAVRQATEKIEFNDASGDEGKMAAAILSVEVDRLYVQWGLKGLEGMLIDGEPATPDSLLDAGPEELVQEALALIKSECGLNESEKKT
jgi:hypothetical protein